MFDSVLNKGAAPKSAFGRGAVISVLLHVGIILFAFWFSGRPQSRDEKVQEVTFFAAPPPPPPPPPKAGNNTPKVEVVEKKVEKKKPVRKPDTFVKPIEEVVPVPEPEPQPEEPIEEPQPEEEPVEEGGAEGGVVGGVEGGTVGGVVGGKIGGEVGGTGTEVLPFGEGMTRPEQTHGRAPQYTREAREARVEGLMLVKCVITVEGKLENCRIVKPLPFMEQAVLDALKTWKFKPITFQGRPVNVDYVIPVRLKLY